MTKSAYADGIVFNRAQGDLGRVGLELSRALRDPRSSDNLILRDGDLITIPPFNAVVTIKGAVNMPSNVAFVEGKGLDYYINAAGGPSRTADEDRAFVIQPSGKLQSVTRRLWLSSMPKPMPGSTVTVPEIDAELHKNRLALVGTIAQVLASTVAIVIAVRR